MSIKIIGTGRYVAQKIVTNDDLASFLDTNDEWISTRTGIKQRHISTGESMCDMCEVASKQAIETAGIKNEEIDLVILATIGGDYITPSLSCALIERLGIIAPAFDVNAACTGFIYSLDIAQCYIETKKARNILIVCAEMMSKFVDWTDRSTCVLFGDGAGACVVTKGNALKYTKLYAKGDTKIINLPTSNGNNPFATQKKQEYLHMEGQEVFKFAVTMIEEQTKLALSSQNISEEDIDYYILHQANKRIIDFARLKLKSSEGKFPVNIEKYGNTSSASVPILLDEMVRDKRIIPGTKILMSAFGAGLSAGTAMFIWE